MISSASGIRTSLIVPVILIATTVSLPLWAGDFRVGVVTSGLVLAFAAIGLAVLVHDAGLISMAHAAYFGIGAYASALVAINVTDLGLVGLLAGGLFGGAAAFLTGFLIRKSTGSTFLMLTVAVGEIASVTAVSIALTGGENGLGGIPRPTIVAGVPISGRTAEFFYVLAVLGVGCWFAWRIRRSTAGVVLRASSDNAARLRSLGYSVERHRLALFTLAGAGAGVAGGLYAQTQRFVSSDMLGFTFSALLLVIVVLGGSTSLAGLVIAAIAVTVLRDELSTMFENWEFILGVLYLGVIYLQGRNLMALLTRPLRRETS